VSQKNGDAKVVSVVEEPMRDPIVYVEGVGSVPPEIAKQLVYAWRALLMSLRAEGKFEGDVPRAFTAKMSPNGSVSLEPFHMPTGVVIGGEEVSLDGPLEHMFRPAPRLDASLAPTLPRNGLGSSPTHLDMEMESRRSARRRRAVGGAELVGSKVPDASGQHRALVSDGGEVEVVS